jgi:hypothetical protein
MTQATTNTAVTPTNTKQLAEALRKLEQWVSEAADEDGSSFDWHAINADEGAQARAALAAHDAEQAQEPVLQDIEQYRMQMAGISTAALGYWKEGDSIHPDYDTVALRDVAKLYAKYDRLFKIVSAYAEQA